MININLSPKNLDFNHNLSQVFFEEWSKPSVSRLVMHAVHAILTLPCSLGGGGMKWCLVTGTKSGIEMLVRNDLMSCGAGDEGGGGGAG